MRNIQMAKGAHTVVNRCARVKPGETVLIVTEPSRMSIAEELGAAVCARRVTMPRGIREALPLPYKLALSIARPMLSDSISTIQEARLMSLSSSRLLQTGTYPATL